MAAVASARRNAVRTANRRQHFGMLVSGAVVEHRVDQLGGRDLALDGIEKRMNSRWRWRCTIQSQSHINSGVTSRGMMGTPSRCVRASYTVALSFPCAPNAGQ